MTSDDDVESLAKLGAVDILINNAGVGGYGNPLSMDFAAIREELEVN